MDIGSSFLPSEVTAAFLWAQLEQIQEIQNRRLYLWNKYAAQLDVHSSLALKPIIPIYSTNNAHIYYLVVSDLTLRDDLIHYLKDNNILSVFHYIGLEKSTYFAAKYIGANLKECDKYSSKLVRLPLYYELEDEQLDYIVSKVNGFFYNKD